jgi:uncharacterized protein YndB with AHSA1/START domain
LRGGDILARKEKSIEITASPEKVWEMLAMDRFPEWQKEMRREEIEKSLEYTSEVSTPEDKYKVGASGHFYSNEMGMGDIDFGVTESLENQRLSYYLKKSGSNQTMGTYTLILEPMNEGTKFTCVFEYTYPWGILGKFLDKLTSRETDKAMEKWCENLKGILEK